MPTRPVGPPPRKPLRPVRKPVKPAGYKPFVIILAIIVTIVVGTMAYYLIKGPSAPI
jgi:hypothetical protein